MFKNSEVAILCFGFCVVGVMVGAISKVDIEKEKTKQIELQLKIAQLQNHMTNFVERP